jgi:segregation and condensation protein B
MYVTTDEFLKHFGLQDLNQMPLLENFIEYDEIEDEEEIAVEEE